MLVNPAVTTAGLEVQEVAPAVPLTDQVTDPVGATDPFTPVTTTVKTRVELRTPVPLLKKVLKERCKEFEEQTKLGFFYDFGGTRDSTGYENYLTNKPINFLQSVGVGIHFPVGKIMTANIDFGIPIGDKALIGQSTRITFSITSNIHNLWCQKYNKKLNEHI